MSRSTSSDHLLYKFCNESFTEKLVKIVVYLQESLDSFEHLSETFKFFKSILIHSVALLVIFYGYRKTYVLKLELFLAVYSKLICHLFWMKNESVTIHQLWSFPNELLLNFDADYWFSIRGLGDEPDMWINRFIAEVLKLADRRLNHGHWARENEYVTVVVKDLKTQLFKTKIMLHLDGQSTLISFLIMNHKAEI